MTSSAAPTDKVACTAFAPLYWSRTDTDKTIAQIKEYNAAGKALCGWGKPPAPKPVQSTTFSQRWLAVLKR
jgi:hypothetical protein